LRYIKDINLQDEKGNTPILHALQQGYFEFVKVFLNAGADLNIKNNENETVLNFAQNDSELKIFLDKIFQSKVETLAKEGIDLEKSIFDIFEIEDVPIRDFIKDAKNIIIKVEDRYVGTSREIMSAQLKKATTYVCKNSSGTIGTDNVKKFFKLFNLSSISNVDVYVYFNDIEMIMKSPKRFFIAVKIDVNISSMVSHDVLNEAGSWVSGHHCQEGIGINYIYRIVETNVPDAGRKKKSRKTSKKKNSKRRKLRKFSMKLHKL